MKKLKMYVMSDGGSFIQGEEEKRDAYCKIYNTTYTVWIFIFDKGIPIKAIPIKEL